MIKIRSVIAGLAVGAIALPVASGVAMAAGDEAATATQEASVYEWAAA